MTVDDPSTRDEIGVLVELVLAASQELDRMRNLVRSAEEPEFPCRNETAASCLETTKPSAAGKAVLVVDDEATIREVLSDLLEGAGAVVDVAGSAEEAMELFRAKKHSVVFTDYDLGQAKGVDLAFDIKAESPATRTVLMTGWDMSRELDGSVDHVLSKPFRMHEVLALLEF